MKNKYDKTNNFYKRIIMCNINLFNFNKINKSNVWIKFDKEKDLQKFLNWNKLINTSFNYDYAHEYFKIYKDIKEPILFNFNKHCISWESNLKNKKDIIYDIKDVLLINKKDISLELKRLEKEKLKLIKYNKKLYLEISNDLLNGVDIHEYQQDLKHGKFYGCHKFTLLKYNISDIENYNILLGISKAKE